MKALHLALLLLLTSTVHAAEISVAVAANFANTLAVLTPIFERQSGHRLVVSSGSSGKLFAQISHGAPFDVFLAADSHYPQSLIDRKLALADSRFFYATGHLALYSIDPKRIELGADSLRQNDVQHIAIANPNTAPYGRAAKESIQGLGVWDQLGPKLVYAESIAQAFQYAASGNAELAFVALSQVKDPLRRATGYYWQVPARLYSPIKQEAVLLQRGGGNAAAKQFLKFLQGKEARAVIAQYGYTF